MNQFHILMYILCINYILTFHSDETVSDTTWNLGFTFCETKTPKESHLYPCCQKCSCESDCQYFGNCCPDKILTPGIQIKYPCVELGKYLNAPRGLPDIQYAMEYHVIDDCPSFALELLYPKCFTLDDLEDFIAVSDPVTDRVYKNKHCALCNGVKHYTEWKLVTDCGLYFQKSYTSRSEWFSYIVKNCSATPWPQKWTDGLSVKCHLFPEKLRKCNSTGRWKQQDDDVQYACESENQYTSSLLYQEEQGKSVFYENAYCKVCNTDINEVWQDLCKHTTVFDNKRGSSEFASFINFMKEDVVDNIAKITCLQSEIWDHYNNMCMAVSCPSATFFLRDKCEHIFVPFPGQVFQVKFKVKSNVKNYIWKQEDAFIIDREITQLFQNENCYRCGTLLIKYDHVDAYAIANYDVRSQGTCTMQFLVKKVQALIAMPLDSIRKDNTTSFTMKPELDDDLTSMNSGMSLYSANGRYCPTVKYIDRSMVDKCPRIVLPEQYILNVSSFKPTTVRGGTICVDEYFRILKFIHNSQEQLYSGYILLQFELVTLYLLHLYNNMNV
ncbi:hypothetical protein ACF0H5_015886 [Mactra antiquata]